MKTTKELFFALVIAGVVACNKDSLLTETSTTMYDDNTVTLSLAISVASDFTKIDKSFLQTRSSDPTVKEAFSINDDTDGLPLFHVVNYESGGFVLVAGDNRLQPVQAYSTKGKFSANKAAYPFGLKVWMESVQDSLRTIKNNKLEQNIETQAAWRKYSEDIKSLMATRSLEPESGLPPEADTLVGPFITDSWHQQSPYNDNLDYCNHYSFYNGQLVGQFKPVLGCGPLAIARVMRYHQYPTSFSWSNMPDDAPQTSYTKAFCETIHEAVRDVASSYSYYVTYDQNYVLQVPAFAIPTSFQCGSFLRNEYGYASAQDNSYSISSYSAMKRDLIDHELPCIIAGNSSSGMGHFWICDGYHYNFEHWLDNNNNPIGVETTYLHYCWGDEDTSIDGWFSPSNVTLYNSSFQYNMRLTNHISTVDYWDSTPGLIN